MNWSSRSSARPVVRGGSVHTLRLLWPSTKSANVSTTSWPNGRPKTLFPTMYGSRSAPSWMRSGLRHSPATTPGRQGERGRYPRSHTRYRRTPRARSPRQNTSDARTSGRGAPKRWVDLHSGRCCRPIMARTTASSPRTVDHVGRYRFRHDVAQRRAAGRTIVRTDRSCRRHRCSYRAVRPRASSCRGDQRPG